MKRRHYFNIAGAVLILAILAYATFVGIPTEISQGTDAVHVQFSSAEHAESSVGVSITINPDENTSVTATTADRFGDLKKNQLRLDLKITGNTTRQPFWADAYYTCSRDSVLTKLTEELKRKTGDDALKLSGADSLINFKPE